MRERGWQRHHHRSHAYPALRTAHLQDSPATLRLKSGLGRGPGLSFTDKGNGTAIITGTPAAGRIGSYPITITAINAASTSTRQLTITVLPGHRR
jgi:hypothetical protein